MERENARNYSECTNIHNAVKCKYSGLYSTNVFMSQICLRGSEWKTSVLFKMLSLARIIQRQWMKYEYRKFVERGWQEKTNVTHKDLSQCYCDHHKSHISYTDVGNNVVPLLTGRWITAPAFATSKNKVSTSVCSWHTTNIFIHKIHSRRMESASLILASEWRQAEMRKVIRLWKPRLS